MGNDEPLARVEDCLRTWDERLGRMDANLLDLDARVRALDPTSFGGRTRERAEEARRTLAELFRTRASVGEVVARARAERTRLSGIFRRGAQIQEILDLLEGPAVAVGGEDVAVTRRGLLGPAQATTRLTLDAALRQMEDGFALVAAAVEEIERAEDQGARELAAFDQKLVLVAAAGAATGSGTDPEETELRRELAALRAEQARDPLGVTANLLQALAPRLHTLAERRTALDQQAWQVHEGLTRARRGLDGLRSRHAASVSAVEAARATLADGVTPAPDAAGLDDLDEWLRTLEGVASPGHWSAAAIGLAKLETAIGAREAAEDAVLIANREALAAADELSGRLIARRAQLAQLRQRGIAGDPGLDSAGQNLVELLDRRPLPLLAAKVALESFEQRLRTLGRSPGASGRG